MLHFRVRSVVEEGFRLVIQLRGSNQRSRFIAIADPEGGEIDEVFREAIPEGISGEKLHDTSVNLLFARL